MNSGFQALHPLLAFIYYLGVISFTMLLNQPIYLLTTLLVMLALWLIVDQGKPKGKLIALYLLMAFLVVLINPIFSRRGATILFYFLDQPVTLESMMYGLLMALSLFIILISFQSYNRVLSADRLTYLFGSLIPRGTLVLVMALRFVPLLYRRWQQVFLVQRTQGNMLGKGSLRERIRTGMNLLSILLTWSLEEAIQSAHSMRARGFGVGKRTSYKRYLFGGKDWLLLSYLLVLAGISLFGLFAGHGVLTVYPRLGSITFSGLDWLYYLAYCAFLSLPLYLEGKELYVWRLSNSTGSASLIPQQAKKH